MHVGTWDSPTQGPHSYAGSWLSWIYQILLGSKSAGLLLAVTLRLPFFMLAFGIASDGIEGRRITFASMWPDRALSEAFIQASKTQYGDLGVAT